MSPEQPSFKPVYIMGAGASVMEGMPVLNDFMKRARAICYGSELNGESREQFLNVFNYQNALYATRQVTAIDLDNLESLFSVIDMDYQTCPASL
jgi:hypothetical protein